MNVDLNGIPHVPSELIRQMMGEAPKPEPLPKQQAFKVSPTDEVLHGGPSTRKASSFRQYKGSFTVEPAELKSGNIDTRFVTLEATDRDSALARLRTFTETEFPGMVCKRFQVSPN
jgi:hypothetical protein